MIIHRPTREYVIPVSRNKLSIQFACQKQLSSKWRIVYWNRFKAENVRSVPCRLLGRDDLYDYFVCEITAQESVKYIRYYIQSEDSPLYFSPQGMGNTQPDEAFEYLYTNECDVMDVPDWAKGAVLYQIFPERFCNGDIANDPEGAEPWHAMPTRTNFCGGDIRGIIGKLDYLSALHIDVLYLTPVFKSPSNHKYDTEDYFCIDPSFGTNDDLKALVKECHQRHIRVILDGVFNHCGYTFAPFQDVLQNGEKSAYKDWFFIQSYPVQTDPPNYECVGYYKWMPKVRMQNRDVRDYFLRVGAYWIEEADIDGWRLDVADEVDFTFWQEFRRTVKALKPDALLIGETWKDGKDMLRGDQMDSVMNYLFRDALVSYLALNASSDQFDSRIQRLLSLYPQPVYPVLYNPIGSHDTDRFLTLCGGEKRRLKLAAAFQMTFPGIPAVYYGDEIGMAGGNDPDCRKAMDWAHIDKDLLGHYQTFSALRHNLPALRYGSFDCVHCDDDTFGFVRRCGKQTVYVLLNRGISEKTICVPAFEEESATLQSVVDGRTYKLCAATKNDNFYHDDCVCYQTKFNVVLPAYHVDIIKIKEETE